MCSALLKAQNLLPWMETYFKKKPEAGVEPLVDLKENENPKSSVQKVEGFYSLPSYILTLKKD